MESFGPSSKCPFTTEGNKRISDVNKRIDEEILIRRKGDKELARRLNSHESKELSSAGCLEAIAVNMMEQKIDRAKAKLVDHQDRIESLEKTAGWLDDLADRRGGRLNEIEDRIKSLENWFEALKVWWPKAEKPKPHTCGECGKAWRSDKFKTGVMCYDFPGAVRTDRNNECPACEKFELREAPCTG